MRAALKSGGAPGADASRAIARVTAIPRRPVVACSHLVPAQFSPGSPLALSLATGKNVSARLHYRHVNHAERWRSMDMSGSDGSFMAAIPADYTASPFPLQYYFELSRPEEAWLYPAFNTTLSNQPYYAVWKRA
jgi:hypothetical protein